MTARTPSRIPAYTRAVSIYSAARFALPPEFYDGRDTDSEGPWWSLRSDAELARAIEQQLLAELPRGHVLNGMPAVAIAKRQDDDDVLFDLSDGRFAVVHLGWSERPETDAAYPRTTVYATWDEVEQRMASDQHMFRPG